ncbi:MAG: DNA gyrase subunit A [Chitinophagaceae bacterium]|jgi:DNA gyrase subunit A|nr:DNA gyrase subunit A [Chitinophagaceae bacterium]HPA22757.1 DNA gyrase subunit A [Ferruginibacter sp.]MBK7346807.1 DNA gyrase subunit A [Chitinophagaceae bacterium]MBK8928597.1 DNA gyrase subunit A [Chitinophagaceae bacterium]QQS63295.1 MAG: DNA gyrase subunit A [Chitinophagaceae bacterium]
MENTDLNKEEMPDNRGKIIPVNIEEQMKTSYIDYSMSVIVGRALPDVRDGLKPVHRRVLFGMNELSNASNKPYKKSARIVGEVMGKYHPHGDKAIYDTMVRMAQEWAMRYRMIDGQGNFGSQDGDMPAAMRYTEVRMQKFAEAMMEDLDKETVDFQLNFDDSLREPTVMPTRVPQLLVNGSSGIAVGMATNMMPHNLSEVVDGCIAYIGNRTIDAEGLMKYVKAPDFPTGGIIYGMDGVKAAFLTGRGRVVVRGKTSIEADSKGREKIIITEVPYQVNRDSLTQRIGELITEKILDGASDVNNESNNKEGTRIVIELRRDAVAQVVVNQLYKHSDLQTSFGINNVALVKGRPKILNLRDLISEFVDFRHEVVVRRTKYDLRKAEERAHILEGYIIALDNLDAVIKLIRESATPDIAKDGLVTNFGMSEIQAKAVLELRLQRLTGMEIDKIREEHAAILKEIERLKEILANESLRFDIIKTELLEVKEKFGDVRKSEIEFADDEINMLDLIEEEDVVVTISHLGYIKRTAATEYRQQRRGGRGAKGSSTRQEDYIEHLFVASTHHSLLFFTEKGRCYWLKVYQIPEGDKTSKGRAVQNLVQIPADDKIRAIIDVKNLEDKDYITNNFIVLCTKKGIIKKTDLEDFSRPRLVGINAINILDGDQLIAAKLTDGNCEIMMAVKSGRAIRFHESKVRSTGRGGIGVAGIEVNNSKDEVVGMICINKENKDRTILVVSEKGYGKRTLLDDPETGEANYRITNRGGKGVKTLNITDKTGNLVGLLDVSEKEDLMITCVSGITIRMPVTQISEQGRATQGVKLIKVDEGDEIAAITNLDEQEEADDAPGASENGFDEDSTASTNTEE